MSRLIFLLLAGALSGCHATLDGDTQTRALIAAQCGGCHVIPAIATARGRVGPSLTGIDGRQFLAGRIPNTQGNMQAFLLHPQALAPGGAMPELNLSVAQADAISRLLLKSRSDR